MADDGEVLTYKALADRLGISVAAAKALGKRRARAGRWARWTGNDGRARVRVPAEDIAALEEVDRGSASGASPVAPSGSLPGAQGAAGGANPVYIDLVQDLRDALERERARADAAEADRDQARQEAEAARVEAAELRGELAAERRRLSVLVRDAVHRFIKRE